MNWLIVIALWLVAAVAVILDSLCRRGQRDMPLFEKYPRGTDASSPVAWLAYIFCWTSQLSPVGALSRLVPARPSRLVLDLYILVWPALGLIALLVTETFVWLWPFFLWRFWEYVAIILYQRVFDAGFPRRLERDPSRFRLRYRPFFIDLVNFASFAILFASIYWANFQSFSPSLNSPREALYFSVLIMTLVGAGDINPTGGMQWVVAGEAMLGILMIVFVIGRLIGAGPLYPREEGDNTSRQ